MDLEASAARNSQRLHPIRLFGGHGYIDVTGRVVVEPTLSCAKKFHEGLGAALRDGRWGYVDLTGSFVIEPRFHGDGTQRFSGDFAVAGREGEAGVIDRTGAWVVEPLWDRVQLEGKRFRVEKDGACGWLADNGTVLVEPRRWGEVIGSAERVVVVNDGGAPAILDLTTGALRRLPAEETRSPGADTIPARQGDRWGWLDYEGRWVLAPSWSHVSVFIGARAVVAREGGGCGLVDRSGRLVVPTTSYSSIRPSSFGQPGMYTAKDARGYWHIDEDGAVLSGPWQDTLVTCDRDITLVKTDSGWGATDKNGRLLIEPTWDEIRDALEGLLGIRANGRWGFIDPRAPSPLHVEPRFDRPGHFFGGLASIDDGRAYIDRSGREVWRRPGPRSPVLGPPSRPRTVDWGAVRDALRRLETKRMRPGAVFGAREHYPGHPGHNFTLGPRLTDEEIASLEREHRIRIPESFRSFLVEVGNGPATPKATGGAGPGHGLYDVVRALADAPRAYEPFDPPRSRLAWQHAAERDEEAVPPGFIVIGTHGCAFDYGIVITGAFAGTIWSYVDPGWVPDTSSWAEVLRAHHDEHSLAHEWCWEHLDALAIETFADVYLAWLDWAENDAD